MFRITDQTIDAAAWRSAVETPASGGFVAFEGWVRDRNHGRTVTALEYEAYEALAVKEGERILEEARERFAIERAAAVHRTGRLEVGDLAVWVGVSAAHRDAAFAACRYVIDELKLRVPIWKCEHYADGSSEWVGCAGCTGSAALHDGH